MKLRLTGALAVSAALVTPIATGAVVSTTVRVEGGASTVIPRTQLAVNPAASATVTARDAFDADTVTVPAASATGQLWRATSRLGVELGFSVDPTFGSFIQRIGPNAGTATAFWRLKVNHKISATGGDQTVLTAGDDALWSFGTDFEAGELDLNLSRRHARRGTVVTATATTYDNDGAASPGAATSIRMGEQSTTADAAGRARLTARSAGPRLVRASKVGMVRAPAQPLCVYANNPVPCSWVTVSGSQGASGPTILTGRVVATPSTGARVAVAIARVSGSRCRLLTPGGALAPAGPCSPAIVRRALVAGDSWTVALGTPLAAGTWRVWSLAVDRLGRAESITVRGANDVLITVR